MRASRSLDLILVFALASAQLLTAQNTRGARKADSPVQLQPYTVELKTTTVQTLANGTTITRESSEIQARDSQERTLRSNTHAAFSGQEPFTFAQAENPVESTQTSWNSTSREAQVVKLPPEDQRSGCWRSDGGHMEIGYGNARPASGGGSGSAGSSFSITSSGASGATGTKNADFISTSIVGGIGAATLSATTPHLAHDRPKIEDLGNATIEGVEVRGQRTTRTIPVGQIGNDQPLVSTTELWIAPSLGIVLRSMRDDPQSGKSTTEVVHLDLTEPPLSTFQPPEGYKVVVEEMHPVACQASK